MCGLMWAGLGPLAECLDPPVLVAHNHATQTKVNNVEPVNLNGSTTIRLRQGRRPRGDWETVPPKSEVGTAHASVPSIF